MRIFYRLAITVASGVSFPQRIEGNPPNCQGDIQSLTLTEMRESLPNVNRAKLTSQEARMNHSQSLSHTTRDCKYQKKTGQMPTRWFPEAIQGQSGSFPGEEKNNVSLPNE